MDNYRMVVLIQAALLAFQSICYFGCQYIQKNPRNVEGPRDERIPLKSGWIIAYITWFPLIALFPVVLYGYSQEVYNIHIYAVLINIVLSCIIYVAYPTTMRRPAVTGDGISDKLLRLVYRCDARGLNCCPSMHCSMCFLMMVSAVQAVLLPVCIKAVVIVLSSLIVVSTLFTKQHSVIDVKMALFMALLCRLLAEVIANRCGLVV